MRVFLSMIIKNQISALLSTGSILWMAYHKRLLRLMFSQQRFWSTFGKRHDIFWSLLFLFLMVLMFLEAEWLVWVALVPLIMLAVRGSIRGIIFVGSIVIFLAGYLWIGWLKLYNNRTLVICLISFYLFFMFFVLMTRLLYSMQGLRLWKAINNFLEDNDVEGKRTKKHFFLLVPPTVWFCAAKIASYTKIGSSWTDLAMFQPMMAPIIWIVGAKGVTCVIVLGNSLIAAWILRRSRGIILAGLCLFLVVGASLIYSRLATPEGDTVKVALIQGNFPQSWEWRCNNTDTVILETYTRMTREASEQRPDIIVWPEYAIPQDVILKNHLLKTIKMTAKDAESYLVFGTLAELEGEINGEGRRQDLAMIISPDTENDALQKYASVRPIPFEPWTIPGNELHPFTVKSYKVGILLCFEETIPTIASELSNKGAELLLSLSNNGRFKRTKGIHLTSLQTRLRAAENRKYIARATNTGVTQVVNPCGRIIAQTRPFTRKILIADVGISLRTTIFSRYGDWVLMIIIFVSWCYVGLYYLILPVKFRGRKSGDGNSS